MCECSQDISHCCMPQENYIKITFGKRMALNYVVQQKALLYAVKHVVARQF